MTQPELESPPINGHFMHDLAGNLRRIPAAA